MITQKLLRMRTLQIQRRQVLEARRHASKFNHVCFTKAHLLGKKTTESKR